MTLLLLELLFFFASDFWKNRENGKIQDFEKKAKNLIFVAYLRTLEKFILVIWLIILKFLTFCLYNSLKWGESHVWLSNYKGLTNFFFLSSILYILIPF